jgi:hypothetical protein
MSDPQRQHAVLDAELTTRLAELEPDDVITLTNRQHPGVSMTGPVERHGWNGLKLGDWLLTWRDGQLTTWVKEYRLTEVKKVPKPYVNHHRQRPLPGDVAGTPNGPMTWAFQTDGQWHSTVSGQPISGGWEGVDCVLLIDGATGRAPDRGVTQGQPDA